MKSRILQVVLAVVIIVLAYLVFESPMKDVRFEQEKKARSVDVVQRLKDIREIQKYYKASNNRFTGSFDTLIQFAKTGQIPVVKMIPDPNDTTFTRSISDTIAYVKISDSLFKNRGEHFDLNKLQIIPFSGGAHFKMSAAFLDKGGVRVPVFEAYAIWDDVLHNMDNQLIINNNAKLKAINKFPGLKVGSIEEVSLDGNWE